MKRSLLVLLASLAVSSTQAQSSYVGFHVSGITSSSGITPFGGLQVGGPVAESVELRLSGFTIILATMLRLDLTLYAEAHRNAEGLRGRGRGHTPNFFYRGWLRVRLTRYRRGRVWAGQRHWTLRQGATHLCLKRSRYGFCGHFWKCGCCNLFRNPRSRR